MSVRIKGLSQGVYLRHKQTKHLLEVRNSKGELLELTSVGELLYYSVEGTVSLMSYMTLCISRGLSFLGQGEGLTF